MHVLFKPFGRLCGTAILLVFTAAAVRAETARPSQTVAPSAAQQERWIEGVTLLESGKFDSASKILSEVAETTTDQRVRLVNKWLAAFEEFRSQRAGRIKEDYDKYVGWIKEEMEAGNWRQAAWYTGMAFNEAIDQDAFRKEPWLLKLVEGCITAAEGFEKEAKWLRAAGIHARLSEVFPYNKEHRDALERCQAHIRLDLTYTPDSDWKSTVTDIVPDMARDSFRMIDSKYLKKTAFKEAVIAGLRQVLRLANEPKMEKVFKGLTNEAATEEFVSRVEAKLQQAEDAENLKLRNLIEVFDRVLEINEETRLFPENVLVYEFVQGALQPLDRFSDVIWPADLQEFNKHTQGQFSGVGIQIRKGPGEPIKVVSPLEDSPAYRAGVQPNDTIVKINGELATKFTINQAVRKITGPPGTRVTLTFKRPGLDKEFDLELERQEITIFTIKGYERDDDGRWKYMIDPAEKIAYVRMTNFTEGTTEELKQVIGGLREQGMRGLIFDLRGNPGGPLKTAVEVSDMFLDGEKLIVSTRDREGKDWSQSSSGDAHFTDFPMIVLANRFSASASEIVTGALQVHQRALVVGERTFGKGSVQQVLRLNNASTAFLKLTTQHWYLPDGRCLHRDDDSLTWGVDPDVELKLVPKEMIKSNELRLKTDILKGMNQKKLTAEEIKSLTEIKPTSQPTTGEADDEGKASDDEEETDEDLENAREDPNSFPEIDPQLDASLLLMRVRLQSDQPWPLRPAKIASAVVAPNPG